MSDQAGPSGAGGGSGGSGSSGASDQALAELLAGGGFCVYPLSWCPHLESVASTTPEQVSVTAACQECGDAQENWLCLSCHTTHCSRYRHSHCVTHSESSGHCLALSYSDLSAWCYGCDSYVDNERLYQVKNAAHRDKFGEEMLKPDYEAAGKEGAGPTFKMV